MKKFLIRNKAFFCGLVFGAVLVLGAMNIPAKDSWIDYWGMVATFLVGVAALYIAKQQLLIKTQESKHFEFERKWLVFKDLSKTISKIEWSIRKNSRVEDYADDIASIVDKITLIGFVFDESVEKAVVESFEKNLVSQASKEEKSADSFKKFRNDVYWACVNELIIK